MRYFKNELNEVYGYDPEDQADFIAQVLSDGWEEITGNWPVQVAPSAIVPETITPRQGVEMLIEADLYDAVVTYLAAIPGKDGMKARNRFERANEFRRDDPLVIAIATAQGMNTEQIDQMFIDAAQYE